MNFSNVIPEPGKPDVVQEILQWLLNPSDDFRGSGRTTEMLKAYIAIAIKYPGLVVRIQDHYFEGDDMHKRAIADALFFMIERDYPDIKATRIGIDRFFVEA